MKAEHVNQLIGIAMNGLEAFVPQIGETFKSVHFQTERDIFAIFELKGEVEGLFGIAMDNEVAEKVVIHDQLIAMISDLIPFEKTLHIFKDNKVPVFPNWKTLKVMINAQVGQIEIDIALKN